MSKYKLFSHIFRVQKKNTPLDVLFPPPRYFSLTLRKIRLVDRGGYSCVFLLLRPMAYPRPNADSARLITAINPSIVNICIYLLSGED